MAVSGEPFTSWFQARRIIEQRSQKLTAGLKPEAGGGIQKAANPACSRRARRPLTIIIDSRRNDFDPCVWK
jgi:hypothetical protein